MPELPEVETVVRELRNKVVGRKIVSVDVRTSKIVSIGPNTLPPKRNGSSSIAKSFASSLAGHKFTDVRRRAKLLIFDVSGPLSLLVHLKMTGQFIFEDRKLAKLTGSKYRLLNKTTAPLVELPSKHTHVVIEFSDRSKLYFNDIRKFGYMKLVGDADVDKVRELNEFGPEPIDKQFTFKIFEQNVQKRKKSDIKQVLLDAKVVAGIGNIYSDEILFRAKVRPDRKVLGLGSEELKAIYKAIRPVLLKAIETKGSSVGDFVRTDGSWGEMGKHHFVYGRKGQKCKRCGTIIEARKFGGRTASFCPKCQL